jgi:hypothetical protein
VARGRLSLENPNGAVHVTAWDRNQVQIDAVKTAVGKQCLEETEVVIRSTRDAIRVHTSAPDMTWVRPTPCPAGAAMVEYSLKLPRSAVIEKLEVVNGGVDASGLAGFIRVSTVNGRVALDRLTGDIKVAAVNGPITARFSRATHYAFASLSSTDGEIRVEVPGDGNCEVSAESANGAVTNAFGFPVYGALHSSQGFIGTIGSRLELITLESVNGSIHVVRSPSAPTRSK